MTGPTLRVLYRDEPQFCEVSIVQKLSCTTNERHGNGSCRAYEEPRGSNKIPDGNRPNLNSLWSEHLAIRLRQMSLRIPPPNINLQQDDPLIILRQTVRRPLAFGNTIR